MKILRIVIYHIVLFSLAALCQAFFLLCLAYYKASLSSTVYLALLWGITALNLAVFFGGLLCFYFGKERPFKLIFMSYLLLAFFAVVWFVLLKTGFMDNVRDKESLEAYLKEKGSWMGVAFISLQFLQVVILPIPSFITVAAGTALFGPLLSSVYSLIGILLGSVVAFLIGRFIGHRAVAWLVGEETLKKWLKKVKGKDKLLLSAMFLLPIFPDDILCFVAGISSMSFWFFFAVIGISRIVAIFTTCYSVSLIPFNTWWGITLWVIFFVGVAILIAFLYKRTDRIEAWFSRKFGRGEKIEAPKRDGTFRIQIVSPDGTLIEKNIAKSNGKVPDP